MGIEKFFFGHKNIKDDAANKLLPEEEKEAEQIAQDLEDLYGPLEEEEEKKREEVRSSISSPQERTLSTWEISEKKGLLGGSIGNAQFVEIKDDGAGVFKPHNNEDVVKSDERELFINRERAAYLIDRFLGFSLVPPTVIREIGNEMGSLQEFVPNALTGYYVDEEEINNEEETKLRIFDLIIGNIDRHGGNFLVTDKKIIAIDNGFSLGNDDFKYVGMKGDRSIAYLLVMGRIPTSLLRNLIDFLNDKDKQMFFRELLGELIEEGVIEEVIRRAKAVTQSTDDTGRFSGDLFEIAYEEAGAAK